MDMGVSEVAEKLFEIVLVGIWIAIQPEVID